MPEYVNGVWDLVRCFSTATIGKHIKLPANVKLKVHVEDTNIESFFITCDAYRVCNGFQYGSRLEFGNTMPKFLRKDVFTMVDYVPLKILKYIEVIGDV